MLVFFVLDVCVFFFAQIVTWISTENYEKYLLFYGKKVDKGFVGIPFIVMNGILSLATKQVAIFSKPASILFLH